jgi:choline monooxygenase
MNHPRTPPSAWYTMPAMHDFDLQHVLARGWQYCGAASALDRPGASLELEVAGQPVILFRDPEGVLRSFYAVCQHRAGPVSLHCGKTMFLQCRYHGWTYDCDGSLRGTPQFERDAGFDAAASGLVPVRHVEWQGMLFVCLESDAPDFGTLVQGIEQLVAPMAVGGKHFHTREVFTVDCNWKVYVDNYLEAYHVPLVHPEYAKTLDYQDYREEVHGWWSVQRSGFSGEQGYYASLGQGNELFYFMLWPNTMLNLAAGRLQVNHVRPLSHDRCEVVFDYYYAESEPSPAAVAEDLRVSARIQDEDAEICARVQKGLASPAYDRGHYSRRREQALCAYHELLGAAYAGRSAFLPDAVRARSFTEEPQSRSVSSNT